ncbi:MAG: chemotaxis protein [Desulfobacterales bacterium]|nr:MAG: chemotaxis protein [Desulfobacterales bacterium]
MILIEKLGKSMKNFKLSVKMIGGFSLTAILIVIIGLISIAQQKKLTTATSILEADALSAVNDILNLKEKSEKAAFHTRSFLSPYLTTKDRADIPLQIAPIRDEVGALKKHFVTLPFSKTVQQEWGRYLAALTQWVAADNRAVTLSNELVAADITNPEHLVEKMHEIEIGHKTLLNKVNGMIFLQADFEGGEDPVTCILGNWISNPATSNPEIAKEIARIHPIHNKFHEYVVRIKHMVAAGKTKDAQLMLTTQLMPFSEKLFAILRKVSAISERYHETFEQLNTILLEDVTKYQDATFAELDDIVVKAKNYAKNATDTARLTATRGKTIAIVCMVVGTILALSLGILLTTMVTRPLVKSAKLAKRMADGDMTRSLEIDQKDEIGVLGNALNDMAKQLRQMLTHISNEVGLVNQSSNELAQISRQMTTGAEDTAGRSSQVADASEQMRVNQNSVAAAMEQAAINGNVVATAAGEMQMTIDEISKNSGQAKQITAQAVEKSKAASRRVDELGHAADEINKVTEAISDISEQTNLLALNATIEAARAGEAGKGFAVVANEIKDLAGQAATATLNIQEKIQDIQKATGITVNEINEISTVISEVDQVVTTIAAAVEEQSATTGEIVNNISQVSQGISEVNNNVAQNSSVSSKIATDISEVSTRAKEMTASSHEVKKMAEDLSKVANTLQEMVAKFKV